MTDDHFKKIIIEYRPYLKTELFSVLMENAELFTDDTKKAIISKIKEAESQMTELYDCQEKRNSILEQGIKKIEAVYSTIKSRFQEVAKEEGLEESAQADQLLSNL